MSKMDSYNFSPSYLKNAYTNVLRAFAQLELSSANTINHSEVSSHYRVTYPGLQYGVIIVILMCAKA